ncbi:MAG: hypothetical protein OK404_02225 [Thaumarchaeota archaeon]|nr:hypothetical protein [Nitrososphaerota archaeon]
MSACKHKVLEFMGEQKTDDGINIYHKCTACGTLLVTTPARKVYGVDGVQAE